MLTRRRGVQAVLRFVASVLIMSGGLLVADAVLTLTWREPLSALTMARQQGGLERQLVRASGDRGLAGPAALDQRAIGNAAARWGRRTNEGDALGWIGLPTLNRRYAMVEGTGTDTLRKGPGHYGDTPLPGRRGTVAVAGHRTTYGAPFRTVDRLERGDPVVIRMPYGRFVYRVEDVRIVPPTALWVKRRVAQDRLVLTACHPLYSAAKRIAVLARFESVEPPAAATRAESAPPDPSRN